MVSSPAPVAAAECWRWFISPAWWERRSAGRRCVKAFPANSWSRTTTGGIPTHPLALLSLQLAEEDLQLFDCDAVAGQHAQHVHQQVWKSRVKNRSISESFRGEKPNYYNLYWHFQHINDTMTGQPGIRDKSKDPLLLQSIYFLLMVMMAYYDRSVTCAHTLTLD